MKKIFNLYFVIILYLTITVFLISDIFSAEKKSSANCSESISFVFSEGDSLYLKIYLTDREYFLELQETVASKNQYIGLQWCIDLLNKYIEQEERKLKELEKGNE